MTKSQTGLAIGAGVLIAAYLLTRKKDTVVDVDVVPEALAPAGSKQIRTMVTIPREVSRVPERVTRPSTMRPGGLFTQFGPPKPVRTGPSMFGPSISPFISNTSGMSVRQLNEGFEC